MSLLCQTALAHRAGASERPLWARPLVMALVEGRCSGVSGIVARLRRGLPPHQRFDLN